MLNYKFRMRIWAKIAQTTDNAEGNLTTEVESTQTTSISNAEPFVASTKYGNIQKAFPTAYNKINEISSILHEVLHTVTKGKYNLQKLYSTNFASLFTDETSNVKFLLNFAKEMFDYIYTIDPVPLNKQQFINIINVLISSPNLNNLSDTNLTGPLAAEVQVGNIKAKILSELNNLKNMAPSA